jgi:hypothetical protein
VRSLFAGRLGHIAIKVVHSEATRDTERIGHAARRSGSVPGVAPRERTIVTLFSVADLDGIRFHAVEFVEGLSMSILVVPGGMRM